MLKDEIRNEIEQSGPMPVNIFMQKVLHGTDGYYVKKQPIGKKGDFVTAPEISQLFGEIIGIWAALKWQEKIKTSFNLVEYGPGKATLMADLLRATKNVKDFHKNLSLYFIDINKPLKPIQKAAIKSHTPEWIKNIDDASAAPTIIIANEFFDALPVIQYVRRQKRWYELMVTNKKDTSFFQFCDQPIDILTQEMLMEEFPNVPIDGIIEIPDEARIIMQKICNRLTNYGGAALIIDYGFTEEMRSIKSYISTLQAIKNHKYANIFESLGEADLTTQVNFSFLSDTAHKNKCLTRIITQREFLLEYGIDLRKELLTKTTKAADTLKDIIIGYHRLIDPQQMGELFKVMIIKPC